MAEHVETTGARPRRSRRGPARRFLFRFGAWQALWWSALGLAFAPRLPGGFWTILALALFVAAPIPVLLGRFRRGGRAEAPGAVVRLLVLRPFWYAQLLLPLLGSAAVIGGAIGLAGGLVAGAGLAWAGPWARGSVLTLGAVAAVTLTAGYFGARRVRTRRLVAGVPGLPAALEGLTIAQISDVHAGPHLPGRMLDDVARGLRAADPDLVVVTGDLVDDFPDDVDHFARVLAGLRPRLGVYVSPGNHDIYAGWREVRGRLERLADPPVRVLVNDHASPEGLPELVIAGLGDPAGRYATPYSGPGATDAAPHPDRALTGVPEEAFVLALAHNPALWPELRSRGVDLTLSGHTHWGQFAIPGLGWTLASPFLDLAHGAHAEDGSALYIHPGTGYWGVPFRLGAPAEIALITLRRRARAAVEDQTSASPHAEQTRSPSS